MVAPAPTSAFNTTNGWHVRVYQVEWTGGTPALTTLQHNTALPDPFNGIPSIEQWVSHGPNTTEAEFNAGDSLFDMNYVPAFDDNLNNIHNAAYWNESPDGDIPAGTYDLVIILPPAMDPNVTYEPVIPPGMTIVGATPDTPPHPHNPPSEATIPFLPNRSQQAGYLLSLVEPAGVAHDTIVVTRDGFGVPQAVADLYTDVAAMAFNPLLVAGGLLVPSAGKVVSIGGDLSNVVSPWDGGNLLFDPAAFLDPFSATPGVPGPPPAGWSISEDGQYVEFVTETWFRAIIRLQVNMTDLTTGCMAYTDGMTRDSGKLAYFGKKTFEGGGLSQWDINIELLDIGLPGDPASLGIILLPTSEDGAGTGKIDSVSWANFEITLLG